MRDRDARAGHVGPGRVGHRSRDAAVEHLAAGRRCRACTKHRRTRQRARSRTVTRMWRLLTPHLLDVCSVNERLKNDSIDSGHYRPRVAGARDVLARLWWTADRCQGRVRPSLGSSGTEGTEGTGQDQHGGAEARSGSVLKNGVRRCSPQPEILRAPVPVSILSRALRPLRVLGGRATPDAALRRLRSGTPAAPRQVCRSRRRRQG